MSEQRHIIKRQTFEVQVANGEDVHWLQTELNRVYHQRIVALIDRCCSELSGADRLIRIDSLEIDIGYIDPQNFEQELVSRLEAMLPQALAAQISRQRHRDGRSAQNGQHTRIGSHLELIAFFARTGGLPWWADSSTPDVLENSLRDLMHTAPDDLRRLMRQLAPDQQPITRLVRHYGDNDLTALLAVLLAAWGYTETRRAYDLIAGLHKILRIAGIADTRRAWIVILGAVASADVTIGPHPGPADVALCRDILARAAGDRRISYAALLDDVYHAVRAAEQHDLDSTTTAILEALHNQDVTSSPVDATQPRKFGSEDARQPAVYLSPDGVPPEPAARLSLDVTPPQSPSPESLSISWATLQAFVSRLPAPIQARLHAIIGDRMPTDVSAWETVYRQLAAVPGLTSPQRAELTAIMHNLRREAIAAALPPDEPTLFDLHFSGADAVYIGNAGLVILWPFMVNFFTHLGLLQDGQFNNDAARHRAAGLLQVLASGQPDFPEYLLPLNKILCGLALEVVFDFGPPPTDDEIKECEHLLAAVIAQAPILRAMTVEGFRGTFLLRAGMVSTRDGMWLLRVERETYDVVLDRFPWGWSWVKLPWMAALIQVEW